MQDQLDAELKRLSALLKERDKELLQAKGAAQKLQDANLALKDELVLAKSTAAASGPKAGRGPASRLSVTDTPINTLRLQLAEARSKQRQAQAELDQQERHGDKLVLHKAKVAESLFKAFAHTDHSRLQQGFYAWREYMASWEANLERERQHLATQITLEKTTASLQKLEDKRCNFWERLGEKFRREHGPRQSIPVLFYLWRYDVQRERRLAKEKQVKDLASDMESKISQVSKESEAVKAEADAQRRQAVMKMIGKLWSGQAGP
eukprot:TRINITY_DN13105_c0_g1_i2.p1 TRINITY_DN13105_c0_g1~~TRINITY_DN13105_c0_g1_i2.p1  ORF type:complete len:264 (-),score=70.07 TRINITY_DN13105_c0_g1_i2:503-1294(-)